MFVFFKDNPNIAGHVIIEGGCRGGVGNGVGTAQGIVLEVGCLYGHW
jgi:hypothetical protein